jgi:hypothetical protein
LELGDLVAGAVAADDVGHGAPSDTTLASIADFMGSGANLAISENGNKNSRRLAGIVFSQHRGVAESIKLS